MATPRKTTEPTPEPAKAPEAVEAVEPVEAAEPADDREPDEIAAERRDHEAQNQHQPPVEPGRTPNPTEDDLPPDKPGEDS